MHQPVRMGASGHHTGWAPLPRAGSPASTAPAGAAPAEHLSPAEAYRLPSEPSSTVGPGVCGLAVVSSVISSLW